MATYARIRNLGFQEQSHKHESWIQGVKELSDVIKRGTS